MPSARATEQPDPLWAQLHEVLVKGLGELDLNHGELAEGCGVTRQVVSLWASPHKDAAPSIVYVARMAASSDDRVRQLGLRLLRTVAAHADADLTDLRGAEGDVIERLDALDRESYEARHELRQAHADGHFDDDELARIAKESDEAATRYRAEANSARREIERRRQQRCGQRGRVTA